MQSRINQPAMTPPGIAFRAQHSRARRKMKYSPALLKAGIVIVIILQYSFDALWVADDEGRLSKEATLDQQFVKKPLIAGRQRIRQSDFQNLKTGERTHRSWRHGRAPHGASRPGDRHTPKL